MKNQKRLSYHKLVITFFKEVIQYLLETKKITLYSVITGENDIYLYQFIDSDVYLLHGTVGCPACAGFLDGLIGFGIDEVMFCGGGGVLDASIEVGKILLVDGAIRDEGFSYHYIKPSRIIYANPSTNEELSSYLTSRGVSYFRGLTWTTDAFYRETKERIQRRKKEGASIVEMEQSGCLAVTQFRNVFYGALIYAGDDVSKDTWDNRAWSSREGIRYHLVMLCKEFLEQKR
jgi:uridine phosphorylase